MSAQAGEKGQLLGSAHHVDGVDLDDTDPRQQPATVTAVDSTRRCRVGKSLGRQGQATGLADRQRFGSTCTGSHHPMLAASPGPSGATVES